MRNLVKFHLIALLPSRPGALLQLDEQRMGVAAIDLDLGEQREGHAEPTLAEGGDLRLAIRLLSAELVARKTEHDRPRSP